MVTKPGQPVYVLNGSDRVGVVRQQWCRTLGQPILRARLLAPRKGHKDFIRGELDDAIAWIKGRCSEGGEG